MASTRAGLIRVALTGAVALMLALAFPGAGVPYLAAGLALLFGMFLIVGRPAILLRERLVRVFLDSALVGVLVVSTGGVASPFFSLYFLAALEIAWIETWPKVAVATAALVIGYPAAVAASGGIGALGSTPVALRTGLTALLCVAVAFLGSEMQGFRKLATRLSSTLANEIDRVESDERLISKFGPVMKVLSLEGILRWTVEAAHTVGGGPYAHVAALKGNHHRTILEGDFDVCPSWWHPSIQRLVLQSCRKGDTVRSEEEIHGIVGFMAIPLGSDEDEKWGAVIVGGGEYGTEEERVLKLLAGGIGPALEDAGEAPGGLDQLTGLPNSASLHRVLRQELSYGRPLTVLAMQPAVVGDPGMAPRDALLQRIGWRLVEALEAKDPYIKEHLRAVSGLALRIGSEISLPAEQMEALASGALLHDVGKIGIPDRILQKAGRLTEDEYAE